MELENNFRKAFFKGSPGVRVTTELWKVFLPVPCACALSIKQAGGRGRGKSETGSEGRVPSFVAVAAAIRVRLAQVRFGLWYYPFPSAFL